MRFVALLTLLSGCSFLLGGDDGGSSDIDAGRADAATSSTDASVDAGLNNNFMSEYECDSFTLGLYHFETIVSPGRQICGSFADLTSATADVKPGRFGNGIEIGPTEVGFFVADNSTPDDAGPLTIEAWAMPTAMSATPTERRFIVAKRDQAAALAYSLELFAANEGSTTWTFAAQVGDGSCQAPVRLEGGFVNVSSFGHAALTIDPNGPSVAVELFVNGVSVDSGTVSGRCNLPNADLNVGNFLGPETMNKGFDHRIDELRISGMIRFTAE